MTVSKWLYLFKFQSINFKNLSDKEHKHTDFELIDVVLNQDADEPCFMVCSKIDLRYISLMKGEPL